MAPIRVDARHFSPDTLDFIRLLHRHRVRYLIVGGEAVILHGHARLTGDVDFLVAREIENGARVFAALQEFWAGTVPGVRIPEELVQPGLILQFGQPPNRIDLINDIDGVAFEQAWRGRVEVSVEMEGEEIPIPYIGIEELILNKRASGRPKDLDDLAYLEEARRREARDEP